jgi:hypothetical protein
VKKSQVSRKSEVARIEVVKGSGEKKNTEETVESLRAFLYSRSLAHPRSRPNNAELRRCVRQRNGTHRRDTPSGDRH